MSVIINELETAADLILSGNIVAIPTETVYGLAASALDDEAIRQVYALKNRPANHPLIAHVAPEWDLGQWVGAIPDYASRLMAHFWPGPLTLVLPWRAMSTSPLVTGGQDSIAIRCPAHPLSLALLRRVRIPLVAPSANPFGRISPTTAGHVQQSFADTSLSILDGGRCEVGIESTIVSALDSRGWQILRPGIISTNAIEKVCQQPPLVSSAATVRAPGRLPRHYEPEKPFYYFASEAALFDYLENTPASVFVLHWRLPPGHPDAQFIDFPQAPDKAAWAFYDSLRLADASEAETIAMVMPANNENGQGLQERIEKAGKPFNNS